MSRLLITLAIIGGAFWGWHEWLYHRMKPLDNMISFFVVTAIVFLICVLFLAFTSSEWKRR